jgi:hypothetical protein
VFRVFDLAPKGRDKSAHGNALGLVFRVLDLAPKGRDKSAHGNALGLHATPWAGVSTNRKP